VIETLVINTEPETIVVEAQTSKGTFYTVSSNTVSDSGKITFNRTQFRHVIDLLINGGQDNEGFGVTLDDRGFFVIHAVGAAEMAKVVLTPSQAIALATHYEALLA
jgi:hypothetical protein